MKRRKRDFSRRERQLIDGFIEEIFGVLRIRDKSGDLRQCGWEAFLSVYRDNPDAFSSSSFYGWRRAYLIIWDALVQAQKSIDFSLYRQVSLDQPVSSEVPVSRIELLQSPHGDFQNSVCFRDYLQRMEPDVRCMAYCLINGSSMDEIQAYYGWSRSHTYRTYNSLRTEIQEYIQI